MNTVPPIIQDMMERLNRPSLDATERDNVASTLEEIARQAERAARLYRVEQAKLHKARRESRRRAHAARA